MCLRTFIQRSLLYGKKVKLGTVHTVKLSRSMWHHIKIRERKAPSRGTIQKCEPHERSPCAPEFVERSQEETLQQERCARGEAWNLAKIFTSSRIKTELCSMFVASTSHHSYDHSKSGVRATTQAALLLSVSDGQHDSWPASPVSQPAAMCAAPTPVFCDASSQTARSRAKRAICRE